MHPFLSRVLRRDRKLQPLPLVDTGLLRLSASTMQRVQKQGVLLACASETGFIDDIADITRSDLKSMDVPVRLMELNEIDEGTLCREIFVLFLTSTTGSGDAPFAADRFCEQTMAKPADIAHLYFGLLCAGDRSYDMFCGFGHELRDWVLASGARPLFDPIDIDCEDDETIEQWRRHVKQVFAKHAISMSGTDKVHD